MSKAALSDLSTLLRETVGGGTTSASGCHARRSDQAHSRSDKNQTVTRSLFLDALSWANSRGTVA